MHGHRLAAVVLLGGYAVLGGAPARAAYILDGNRFPLGAYAYAVPPDAELVRRILAEQKRYAGARLDRFGGDKTLGIGAEPTGRWRLQKIEGRWWFITPEGNPFIMIAVDGAMVDDPTNMNTVHFPGDPAIARNSSGSPPGTAGSPTAGSRWPKAGGSRTGKASCGSMSSRPT